jgi:hypothetical protein
MEIFTTLIIKWEKQCTGAHTYATTHRNKTVNVYTIKHIYIYCIGY